MKRRILLLILLAAAVVAVVGYRSGWFRQDQGNRLAVSGNIELTEVDISFKVPGRLVELDVDEGTLVKKGQVIARIDRDQVQQQKSRDEASLESSEMQFAQSEASVRWESATLASDIALKKAQLRAAQAHLDALLAGSRPQEVQQARGAVADAQAQFDQAQADWSRAEDLFKNDDISKQQHDQYKARLDSTKAVLQQAQDKQALVVEGPRKEDIDAARADVASAEAAVEASQANQFEVKRRQQDVAAHRAETAKARAQVAMTDTQINDTVVTSPIDGVVLVKSAELGEVLAAGTTVVTIGDIDHPWLRGYISETDLGKVKLGQEARLTSDSYAGKTYAGRISFISAEAEFTPKQIQTKEERVKLVYRIKIEADNRSHDLKSNMPVDAEIQLN